VPQRELVHRRNALDYSSFSLSLQIGRAADLRIPGIHVMLCGCFSLRQQATIILVVDLFRPCGAKKIHKQ
jgi:hypothetical protein